MPKASLAAGAGQVAHTEKKRRDSGRRTPAQADLLVGIGAETELCHSAHGTGYADVIINGHRETWPIRSRAFRRWLCHRYYEQEKGAPNSEALQAALNVIEARAQFDSPQIDPFIRVGASGGKLYLDLTDAAWRAVEIDANGWCIVDRPSIRFRRSAGMKPLPEPVSGGSVEALRRFLNVSDEAEFILALAWLLAALRHKGPYPVLVLSGEQGSAKSTFSAILRAIADPNSAPLRALPREDRDLYIAATNGHVLSFDNVSRLPTWISDTLCRLATGGGFAVRQLYTDQDEILFNATRPVILNGIEDIVARPDLADRAIFLTLEPIPEESRKTEKELWAEFDEALPQILGALLDAMVHGLRQLPDTKLQRLPRMADFALWVTACESALWPAGSFEGAYTGNRDKAVDNVIEADPVASAIRSLMAKRTEWTGTASDLLGTLCVEVGELLQKAKTWPKTPRALSGRVRRAATFLRKVGIQITFDREGRARTRMIRIVGEPESTPMPPSAWAAPSATRDRPLDERASARGDSRTVHAPADANRTGDVPPTARDKLIEPKDADSVDGADAEIQSQWESAEERAAILEYEAGFSREEAERLAGVGIAAKQSQG